MSDDNNKFKDPALMPVQQPTSFAGTEIPDLIEPLRAVRYFKDFPLPQHATPPYVDDDPRPRHLMSLFVAYTWHEGVNEAYCDKNLAKGHANSDPNLHWAHTADTIACPDCSCGFYAYWDLTWALPTHVKQIVGVVELSGRTQIGPHGIRAQYAKVLGISAVAEDTRQGLSIMHTALPIYEHQSELLREYSLTPYEEVRQLLQEG
jgi:hypothetical protein